MKKRPLLDVEWNRRSFAKKFWARVDMRGDNECWPWRGTISKFGYGTAYCPLVTFEGAQMAHRVAYFLAKGYPGDLNVCHACDNGPCCNPAHLVLSKHSDNMQDMLAKGRHGTAKLSPAQVLDIWRRLSAGEGPISLAKEYGVGRPAILRIRDKKAWARVIEGFDLWAAELPPRPQPPQPPLPTLPPLPAMLSAPAPIETIDDHPIIRMIMSRKNNSKIRSQAPIILQPVASRTAITGPTSA